LIISRASDLSSLSPVQKKDGSIFAGMPTNRAMKRSLLILAAGLFGMLSDARADGFIVGGTAVSGAARAFPLCAVGGDPATTSK